MLSLLSTNGGTSAAGFGDCNRLMVATVNGIRCFERPSPGEPWRQTAAVLEHMHVSALLAEPDSGLILAGGHGTGGLWASVDGGETWSRRDTGIESPHIYTLARQERANGVRLYCGTEPVMLYFSDDLGLNWQKLPTLLEVPGTDLWTFPPPPHWAHVKNIAWHPENPDRLYVCIEQGALLMSEDAGQSWVELDQYADAEKDFFRNDNHRVLIKPSDPQDMFMCGGEGLYRSRDAGQTWQHVTNRDFTVGYPDAMFLDPRDDNALFMAGPHNPPRMWREQDKPMADPAVLHSADNGATWRKLGTGLPEQIVGNIEAMSLYHSGAQISLFTGTATGEVYGSDDAGETWSLVADQLPPISKGGHYRWFVDDQQRQEIERRTVEAANAR